MKVLIGCEESQEVMKAFRRRGHEAYSCDVVDSTGGFPQYHLKMDVMDALDDSYDLIVLHPPCTCLAVSGNGTYGYGKPSYTKRLEAAEWTKNLWQKALKSGERVAMENPVGVLNSLIPECIRDLRSHYTI